MLWLKQSTAVVIPFGPFLDKADGLTLLANATTITDIDHATTGIFLSKNGGDAAIRHQNVTASIADDYGMMRVTLDTTDTNTLWTLRMSYAKAATYLPVWADFMVVPANVWDSIFGADKLDVAVVEQANIDFGATQKASITAAVPTVAAIQSGLATPTNITAGTITTVTNLTNAPTNGDLTATMKTSIGTAVETQLTAANTELTAVPSTTGGLRPMIQFLFEYFRNKKTVTSSTETLFKEDASTSLGTASLSDNGTTFTHGAMS